MPAPQPTPVHDVAQIVGVTVGAASALLTTLLGVALTRRSRFTALVPGVISGALAYAAARQVAGRATPQVTPTSDPKDDTGRSLRPVDAYGELLTSPTSV
jgi:hypothetical protein